MKKKSRTNLRCIALMLGLIWNSEFIVAGQTASSSVTVLRTSIQTVGGISYATFVESVPVCTWTGLEPIRRSGTNLVQVITRGTGIVCVDCDCYHSEANVAVLGHLEPGSYSLTVALRSGYPPPVLTNVFFRVRSNSEPTLRLARLVSDGSQSYFVFGVAGVAGPIYEIQTSADLKNWQNVSTSFVAPFEFAVPVATNNRANFYRVSISPNSGANYPPP